MSCYGGAATTAAGGEGSTGTTELATTDPGVVTGAPTTGAPTTGATTLDPTTTGAATTGTDATGADTTGTDTTGTATTGPVDQGECTGYKLVLNKPGAVLWVNKDVSMFESSFLQPGEGFYCVRVEFDLQTLDNLDQLAAADPEGCPEQIGLASVFGTTISGEVLATAFFHAMDRQGGACTPTPARMEVGNYLDYVQSDPGPWAPGQIWHVILEAKPFLTRIAVYSEGKQLGPIVAANLYPASVAETRDPVVRLGLPMPVEDRFYPWYGATYANLQVWADVAPPP